MNLFGWNLVLAVVWSAVLGSFSLANLVAGFVLGFAVIAAGGEWFGSRHYARKTLLLAEFAAFFVGQLVLSSLRVATDIVTPAHRARPGIVAVPLDVRGDGAITLLANLVSLTPGTLSLDVAEDRSTLFVHVMFVDDAERVRREIKDGFERRVLELLR